MLGEDHCERERFSLE